MFVLAVCATEAESVRLLYWRSFWTGIAGAALILTRETFAVVVPLIGLWMAHRVITRTTRLRALGVAMLVTGVAAVPGLMWTVVQSVRFERLVTISEKGPLGIELGHNPLANGTYNAPLVGIGQPTGLAFVQQYPARSVVLSIRKMLYFWGVLRDGWNVPRPSAVWLWRASTGLVPLEWFAALARGGWLLILFVVALWQLGRVGVTRWWCVPGAVLVIMLVHVITLASHRYALTTLPLVFVLASGPLLQLVRMFALGTGSATKAAALFFLAIVIGMQFPYWPLQRRLEAADLEGLNADNRIDEVARREVRVADAARGVRPVVLLTDEVLSARSHSPDDAGEADGRGPCH